MVDEEITDHSTSEKEQGNAKYLTDESEGLPSHPFVGVSELHNQLVDEVNSQLRLPIRIELSQYFHNLKK